jgi:hypothetical protein
MYFGLQEAKPPPCPLLLTEQGGSIQCIVFISSQTCNMILHNFYFILHTIKYTLLHYEKIYKGINNKQHLLMCGIFQYSNMFAVGYLISMDL